MLKQFMSGEQPATGWKTSEPPQDGKPIVAIGRVIYNEEACTCVDPFVSVICWGKTESGYVGWTHFRGGLAITRTLEDEVRIDYWIEYPWGGWPL